VAAACEPAQRRENGNGKTRLHTLDDLDARTRSAKRARAMIADLEHAVAGPDGEVSEPQRQLIRRAAALGAQLEHFEALMIEGQPVDIEQYVTSANAQRRLLATLGLKTPPQRPPRKGTLADYLDEAERAGAPS
jgi:hypothetical protein